jgi:hypothetical protein
MISNVTLPYETIAETSKTFTTATVYIPTEVTVTDTVKM